MKGKSSKLIYWLMRVYLSQWLSNDSIVNVINLLKKILNCWEIKRRKLDQEIVKYFMYDEYISLFIGLFGNLVTTTDSFGLVNDKVKKRGIFGSLYGKMCLVELIINDIVSDICYLFLLSSVSTSTSSSESIFTSFLNASDSK